MSTAEYPKNDQVVEIPWSAWHGDGRKPLTFPEHWDVRVWKPTDAGRISDEAIAQAMDRPIGSQPLAVLASNKKHAVIAVEDTTRPARLQRVLKAIIDQLNAAGLDSNRITCVICGGAHSPMTRQQMEAKLGSDVMDRLLILNHNPHENLMDTGMVLGKTPVKLNRVFMEADLRILVGSIIPHSFAGFSSGGKLILPGLADMGTLERSHKYVMMGFRGGVNDVETNKFRKEIEDVARQVGVDFFVGIVPNTQRQVAGVFAGDVVAAHRAGVDLARKVFATAMDSTCDVGVFNAYPKDMELLQADAALIPLKTTKQPLVAENGTIVLTTCCHNGLGYHGLFGHGMRLFKKPIRRRHLGNRNLVIFSEHINQREFATIYWDGYVLANQWEQVLDFLRQNGPDPARVAVFPWAPLQLVTDHVDSSVS